MVRRIHIQVDHYYAIPRSNKVRKFALSQNVHTASATSEVRCVVENNAQPADRPTTDRGRTVITAIGKAHYKLL